LDCPGRATVCRGQNLITPGCNEAVTCRRAHDSSPDGGDPTRHGFVRPRGSSVRRRDDGCTARARSSGNANACGCTCDVREALPPAWERLPPPCGSPIGRRVSLPDALITYVQ